MAAKQSHILTPSEVGQIRSYVRQKHPELPPARQADIVADAMRRVVMRQLPDFGEDDRRILTDRLIRTAVLEQKRPIGTHDLLHASLQPGWDGRERLAPLHRWVEERLQREMPLDRFVAAVERHLEGGNPAGEALLRTEDVHLLWDWLEQTASPPASAALEAGPALFPADGSVPASMDRGRGAARVRPAVYAALSAALLTAVTLYGIHSSSVTGSGKAAEPPPSTNEARPAAARAANELPPELQYREVDLDKLTAYLKGRNSLLAQPAYRDAIVAEAERQNIHPLLLFAITGQEQGFVPADGKMAETIANNPFNVYHSWQDFNTSIGHSARVAATTIVNLSRERPTDVDPIAWINRKYAEDPAWHVGVSKLLRSLRQAVEGEAEEAAGK